MPTTPPTPLLNPSPTVGYDQWLRGGPSGNRVVVPPGMMGAQAEEWKKKQYALYLSQHKPTGQAAPPPLPSDTTTEVTALPDGPGAGAMPGAAGGTVSGSGGNFLMGNPGNMNGFDPSMLSGMGGGDGGGLSSGNGVITPSAGGSTAGNPMSTDLAANGMGLSTGPTVYPPAPPPVSQPGETGKTGGAGGGEGYGMAGGSVGNVNTSTPLGHVVSINPAGGGVAGGAGGANPGNQAILKAAIDQYNQAKQANVDRYAQALGLTNQQQSQAQTHYDEEKGLTTANATSQKAELDQRTKNQQSDALQRMISGGLGNTTVLPSVQSGIQHQADLSGLAIDANQQNAQLGLASQRDASQQSAQNQQLQTIIGRTDSAPDINTILQLVASGGGGGIDMSKLLGTLGNVNDPTLATPTANPIAHLTPTAKKPAPKAAPKPAAKKKGK